MRTLPTLVAAAAAVALAAVPASADQPEPGGISKVLEYTNPCTGEVHEYTYSVDGRMHTHENNAVGIGTSTIETADGYIGSGPDPIQFTPNLFIGHSTYLLTNEETGSVVRQHGAVMVDLVTGDVLVDELEWTCIHPPT